MDGQDIFIHHSNNSSTSAIDLTGTPTGLASAPPSPSLGPSDIRGTVSRRRTSWGRLDAGLDPLRLELPPAGPSTSARKIGYTDYTLSDDPFYSPTDDRQYNYSTGDNRYPMTSGGNTYSTAQPGQSTASLIAAQEGADGTREDDDAHLTSNMSHMPRSDNWIPDVDAERTAGVTSRKRNTLRYSTPASPLKKTGTAIKSMSKNIRRVSLRVVNLAGAGLENQIRLEDDDADDGKDDEKNDGEEPLDLRKNMPLRGRTLGFFGPQSKVRLALLEALVYKWTEPTILALIIVNAIVLTIQAAPTITLPQVGGQDGTPSHVRGYFHTWEDWSLFILFAFFTLEAFARICVSGFLLDPEVPTHTLLTSLFSSHSDMKASKSSTNFAHQTSLRSQGSLSRGNTVTRHVNRILDNLQRPFRLYDRTRTAYHQNGSVPANGAAPHSDVSLTQPQSTDATLAAAQNLHAHLRNPSQPTYLSNLLQSERHELLSLPFRMSINEAHDKTQRNVPYLRHSWSRIDFVAIVSFWISFALAMADVERGKYHIGVFRAMSVIRTARLLTITSGTTTIMHSLKTARPLLASVAYFVLFAMVLFSIIGTQSFQGSLRRSCWINPTQGEQAVQNSAQFCGGFVDPVTLNKTGYIQYDGSQAKSFKGYICPLGQVCKETENPFGGVESFDNLYYSALQVIIVASANGWSPLMYSTVDSEFFISAIFFIFCVIVLNFWLINLFVAVITNTFAAIRSDTNKSAFGAAPLVSITDEHDDGWDQDDGRRAAQKKNPLKTIYDYSKWCWVFLALASLVLQATRTVEVSSGHESLLNDGELIITLAFDVELVIRFVAALPEWRSFFIHGNNWLDLFLAIGSSVIQIPMIHNSSVYPWFTIFQLARFYRVILEVPRMRPLLLAVFGNMYGLANMTLFLILVNYIAALVSIQLLRGDVSSSQAMNFGQIFTAFLAVYQIFSSENWTSVLYEATQAEIGLGQTVIVAIFITAWLLFANFIVLQMFIAVINENFQVAEESKKARQASNYWATHQPEVVKSRWVHWMNPYRWVDANPVTVKVENLRSDLVLPMQKALVQDFKVRQKDSRTGVRRSLVGTLRGASQYPTRSLRSLQRLFAGDSISNDVPLAYLRKKRRETVLTPDVDQEETERHLELLAAMNSDAATSEDINEALYERRAQKADFIRDHPSYDKTFWIFSQKNVLRKTCQKMVSPSNGERIFGEEPSSIAHPLFQLTIMASIVAAIVVEGVATPLYRRRYYAEHGLIRDSWFDIAESAFGLTLIVEFLIKVIADGFMFTPNAYVRSIWNVLDFIILGGLLINVVTSLVFIGGLSRLTRSLKALRALRFITLVDRMRTTFQSLIISGAIRILDAALLAILYMIPYAVWGLNIFAGQMNECNNTNSTGIADCTNEFNNAVLGTSFGFLTPQVWNNPSPSTTFSFDDFRSSLLILFEIVSLEGWVDVMTVATSITGAGEQPQTNSSMANAIFFLIYNLMGAVVILTLFVSIIIGNFSSKTGTALLTQAQREWIDLQKLFTRQRPSKRPIAVPTSPVRAWCYDRAVHKHGWWSRAMTGIFILHIFALMTQTFNAPNKANVIRNNFFLAVTFVYIIDTVIRFFGLGWRSFRANGWNIFDIIVAVGSFVSSLVVRFGQSDYVTQQLQKLFLVSIAFKLVQRTNSLNQLFKTAVASLPVILSLLSLWFILFLFFAILYVEVFGLTKWNSAETRNQNYYTVGSALVMLAFMSTGEGWNQYMHDFALTYPRCTNASTSSQSDSDCGSVGWAFTLFIAWNLLSMYIFVNMFTGVVVENFSYVFQTSGGAKSITREEMRAFKKIWAQCANKRTGYLERSNFVNFFSKLSGAFEVRIYPVEYSIPNMKAVCQADANSYSGRVVEGIDLDKLQHSLSGIDYASIRRRRNVYSRLYHEASISHHRGRGMSFTEMLMLLAHHKLIVDREALVLKDLVVRTETNKLVTDLVNLDRVQSLLKMISLRRRFLALRDAARLVAQGQQDIPSIVVDTLPETPPTTTRDITSDVFGSPAVPDRRTVSIADRRSSIGLEFCSGAALSRSRRTSDMSMLSADLGYRFSRDPSPTGNEDPQEVLSQMQNSIWGEMMEEAGAEEDEHHY